MERVMKMVLFYLGFLFVSAHSYSNEIGLSYEPDLFNNSLVELKQDSQFDLGYCNPALNYCSASFDFQSAEKMDPLLLADTEKLPDFAFSDPKGPNCLSVDFDSDSTEESIDYDCGVVLEVIKAFAH
jgi:hypothetical protein